ncbi:MAG TPA: 4Fe-4S dicluster domain-containing protein [Candidatus Atribacteria bacterium]|nr:4Fe-4S dicluster domain-containing protein [Candidatus Atribacteria bacterium]
MISKKVIFTFSPRNVERPVTYQLIKDYGLWVNILQAKFKPSVGGKLVLELKGETAQIEEGLNFVRQAGVSIELLEQEVIWDEKKCSDCGACISICPTGVLSLDKATFKLKFDYEKCIVCGNCVEACPLQAIKVTF